MTKKELKFLLKTAFKGFLFITLFTILLILILEK
jgi:hypothetical protein